VMEAAGEVRVATRNGVWRYELVTIGCSGVSSDAASFDSP